MLSLVRNISVCPCSHIRVMRRTMSTQTQTHKQPCVCCKTCNPLTEQELKDETKFSGMLLMSGIFCYVVTRLSRDKPDSGINQSDPTGLREIRKNWNNKI